MPLGPGPHPSAQETELLSSPVIAAGGITESQNGQGWKGPQAS